MFRALAHSNFRLYWSGQGLSLIGTWLQQVAMGWLTYRLSGSAWLLGVVSFCGNIGVLVLAPFAGALIDRIDKRRALFATQILALGQAAALAWLTASGRIEVWHLVALALALGVISAFDMPLRQALLVHLVEDRASLPNAIALNSMAFNAARVAGPAIGGVLIAWLGEAWCFALNAASFAGVLAALVAIAWPDTVRPAPPPQGFWASWLEGARYAWGFEPIRTLLILLAVLSATVGPYTTLLPAIARDAFGGGPHTLGLLLACAGSGAIAGTLWLAGRHGPLGLGRVIARAAPTAACALVAFALSEHLALAAALLALAGGGLIVTAAASNTILQTVVDNDKRGRVMSFYTMAFVGVFPLGSLFAGALAERLGPRATLVGLGAAGVLAALVFAVRLPRLRAAITPAYQRLGLLPPQDAPVGKGG